METNTTQQDFIHYPTNRVVGTIVDTADAHAAIEALLQAGFDRQDIDILHGEAGIDRLDPTGAEHGFLAQFQRTLIRIASPAEEFKHLSRHIDDVRAGRIVIMVLA
jgi:NAD(P)-dependent dehydrogenase (short-subunit alcohol dehydrogenase family)